MFLLFLKAFIIWLGLSIPTGPVGILCIKNTLNRGKLSGFVTGLWASLADMLYSIIIVSSMTGIIVFLKQHTWKIKIVAFLILFSLALYTLSRNINKQSHHFSLTSGVESFFSSFLIAIMSPSVLISFVIAFTVFSIQFKHIPFLNKIIIVGWVLLGSVVWWYLLSSITHIFKHRLPQNILWMVNKISGIILVVFAILVLFYDIILKFFH